MRALVASLLLFASAPALTACVNGRDCSLVGCEQGIQVDFATPYVDAGTYTITVDVDAEHTTCTLAVPAPQVLPGKPCDHDSVGLHIGLAPERALVGVGITSTDARSVTIRIVKDGAELAKATFAPAYASTAGPNGSDCDPKSCTFATKTFP